VTARGAAAAVAIAVALGAAGAARANGLDLSVYEGKPGEEVAFSGHTWMTCCPPQPYDSVRLRLVKPNRDRVELTEADVDEFGSVFATFEVPEVPPGTYEIEPCGAPASVCWRAASAEAGQAPARSSSRSGCRSSFSARARLFGTCSAGAGPDTSLRPRGRRSALLGPEVWLSCPLRCSASPERCHRGCFCLTPHGDGVSRSDKSAERPRSQEE
jgi:hypothetical protein